MTIEVSVVLPTHNRASTLARAINSVLNQTFSAIELIVVDDGSDDSTPAILQQYESDPRVRVVRHARPRGPGAARNAGVRSARAEWIAFQDSDDSWQPTKLDQQWQLHLAQPDLDLIFCNARDLDASGTEMWLRTDNADELQRNPQLYLLTPLRFIPPTWLIRKTTFESAGGFREDLLSCEDWELCLRLSDFARFGGLSARLVDKYRDGIGVFGNLDRRYQGTTHTLNLHRDRWLRAGRRRQLASLHATLAYQMLRAFKLTAGATALTRAMRERAGAMLARRKDNQTSN